jgi:hypothetical protein
VAACAVDWVPALPGLVYYALTTYPVSLGARILK